MPPDSNRFSFPTIRLSLALVSAVAEAVAIFIVYYNGLDQGDRVNDEYLVFGIFCAAVALLLTVGTTSISLTAWLSSPERKATDAFVWLLGVIVIVSTLLVFHLSASNNLRFAFRQLQNRNHQEETDSERITKKLIGRHRISGTHTLWLNPNGQAVSFTESDKITIGTWYHKEKL